MRTRLADVRWDELAASAGGVGVFAILLFAFANVDPEAVEVRGALLGMLGVVVAILGSTIDVTSPPEEDSQDGETRWYEADGSFRGM